MGFTWAYRSKSWKKKKSLSLPVANRDATIDGNLLNGSNDERFFDAMESPASDYDEFYSVKGDSTPIYDGTPRSRLSESDASNKDPSIDSIAIPKSESRPRKNLSAFLEEELGEEELDASTTDYGNLESEEEDNRSMEKRTEHSLNTSEASPGENTTGSNKQSTPEVIAKRKSKSQRGMNCCLPCRPGGAKSIGG